MMAGLKKKRRIQLVTLGFGCLAAGFAAVYFALGDAVQFFYAPSQLLENPPAAGQVFRIGGLVEEGSLVRQGQTARFTVTDGGHSVPVTFTGVLPDLISEGQSAIATGQLRDGVFVAQEVLAKHDEEYMPREVIDALKEQGVYRPAGAE